MATHAHLRAIEYHLPKQTLTTAHLAAEYPDWSVEKISAKTGIDCRHIAASEECASDLAVEAARQLFDSGACKPSDIDFLLLCTQSPDYFLPTTACLIQSRLDIPTTAGAFDFNLGCSGYVYGLGLAEALISSGQANSVMLLTADTYSKFLNARDRSVRTIFGDAASASLLVGSDSQEPSLGPFIYGTDGAGGPNLIVPAGGVRRPRAEASNAVVEDDQGNFRSEDDLYMNGPEIFAFTLAIVPDVVYQLLRKAGKTIDQVDLFVFHQANKYMLDHLRKRLNIPAGKFYVSMADCGNTVSSTIPIALKRAFAERNPHLNPGSLIMLVGFGVGYSWSGTFFRVPSLGKSFDL